jgi:hypothetical protein
MIKLKIVLVLKRRQEMKRFTIFWIFLLLIMLSGCSVSYRQNIKPDDLNGGNIDVNSAYIYGTYEYDVRSPLLFKDPPYFYLDFAAKIGNTEKEIYVAMDKDQGYFFTTLMPGDYTLHRIILIVDGEEFDSVTEEKDFKADAGKVLYLGNIRSKIVYNTLPFIWWGIKSVSDNFQNDSAELTGIYKGIPAANITDGFAAFSSISPFEKRVVFEGESSPGVAHH